VIGSGIDSARHGTCSDREQQGFTLLEMVIVLAIMGYLLKSFIVPFGAHFEQGRYHQTEQLMHKVAEAIIGFAAAHERLPCPAGTDTSGWERSSCPGALATGFVPAATLGLSAGVSDEGYLLDGWNRPIRYAVSVFDHPDRGSQGVPDFTSAGEMAAVGLRHLASGLTVCRVLSGGACPRDQTVANELPFVLVSHGQEHSATGRQIGNLDDDRIFISGAFSVEEQNPFDDIVVWVSENVLIYEMLHAGVLP